MGHLLACRQDFPITAFAAGLDSPAPSHKVAAGNTAVSFCALVWCKHALAGFHRLVVLLKLLLLGGWLTGQGKSHALATEEVGVDEYPTH